MRKSLCLVSILAIQLFLAVGDVDCAEIKYREVSSDNPKKGSVFLDLDGPIVQGDEIKIKQLVEPYIKSSGRNVLTMRINSNGGDVAVALELGRYLRKNNATVAIEDRSSCVSACVFVFLGGTLRSLSATSVLGIHRPYMSVTGTVSHESAQKSYKEVSRMIYEYVEEMNIQRALVEDMLRIEPQNVRRLSPREMIAYGIVHKDFGPYMWGVDPVVLDVEASEEAKRFGLSKPEYYARKNRAKLKCQAEKGFDVIFCEQRFMKEKID